MIAAGRERPAGAFAQHKGRSREDHDSGPLVLVLAAPPRKVRDVREVPKAAWDCRLGLRNRLRDSVVDHFLQAL